MRGSEIHPAIKLGIELSVEPVHLHTNKILSAGFTHRDFIILVFYSFLRPRSASVAGSAQEVPSCLDFLFVFSK